MHPATLFGFALIALVAGESYRVEYQLTKMDNSKGILSNKKKCDVGSKCDPKLTGYVDTEKPLGTWPGPKAKSDWTKIFEASDEDSPRIGKIVSRDCCSSTCATKANLRIDAVDSDVTTSDQIEQFECLTSQLSGYQLSSRETGAPWSEEKSCVSKFNPNDVTLKYKWRAFKIPSSECGRPVGSSKTG